MINELFSQEWFDSAPKIVKGNVSLQEIRDGAARFLAATEEISRIQKVLGKRPENAVELLEYMKNNFSRSEIAHSGESAERDMEKWRKRLASAG